mmetsp:Transcript_114771/g.203309  ORF Transcript_114771/g.203309 Transcript_114771/m.203309 type:complete len:263 (+) Transcript_114771:92-880(+)
MNPASDEEVPLTGGKAEGTPSSMCSFRCCGCCCLIVVGLILALLLRVWTAECAVMSFDAKYILPENAKDAGVTEPFDRGTVDNMKLDPALDLDLAGTWWMDGNPLTKEQLFGFAGAYGSAPYPTSVFNPSSKKGRWTWSDDFAGRFIIAYYSLTESPEVEHNFSFVNSTYASIIPIADVFGSTLFGFKYIDKDAWDRVDTYILHRVVAANGSAGPYWDKFIDWYTTLYPSGRMLVYSSDNGCMRKCQYFLPCFACGMFCGGE